MEKEQKNQIDFNKKKKYKKYFKKVNFYKKRDKYNFYNLITLGKLILKFIEVIILI